MFLFSDAILGVKTGLLIYATQFSAALLKIAYARPLPFWTTSQIQSSACDLRFGAPSLQLMLWTAVPAYVSIMYFDKYAQVPIRYKALRRGIGVF